MLWLVSPLGKIIVSGSGDKTLKIWHSENGKFVKTIGSHDDAIWSIALSPDEQAIASGSADNAVKIWQCH
ncbi:hypothetical protein H6G17_01415 [Chroococcidiopsis sp. FACHB-1243]|nr:hypothetical protein [Chroococcidiopsis sp. [FACHB-1243]]